MPSWACNILSHLSATKPSDRDDPCLSLSRRAVLGRCGMGLGLIGLAGVMADDNPAAASSGASAACTRIARATGIQGAAFRRQGQAGRPSVHERRAVAHRYV